MLNNRYEIIKPLGSGGFGDTYVAKDTQMPSHRRCVIKQLKPVTNSPQIAQLVQERFQREAAILEELGAHPQIPQLYAYFEDQGNYYLVEESVEGSTLTAQMAQRGTMRESDVREMLTSLLPVLEFVHSKQIVHRDIKPDNIIIRAGDNQPVLIDFGAVKETMGTVVNSVGNATSSIVIGTPGFMPSEQAAGRPIYSSDLYALGLTAIYLLTGKIPQELQTDYHTGEIIWQNQVPLISPTFAAVLDKAIKSHPKERYHTASEMLAALQAPVYQAPPTVPSVPATDGTYVAPSTVVSSPAAGAPTVASTPAPAVATTVSPPAVGGDWQKAAITGTIIGAFILGGFWMTRSQPGPSSNTASNQSTTTTPSATPSPTSVPAPATPPAANSKPSPVDAVKAHYNQINDRDYTNSWQNLSSRFKAERLNNSYDEYLIWWSQVKYVNIDQINLINNFNEQAMAEANLTFYMNDGKQYKYYRRFRLIWDQLAQKWLIDETTTSDSN